MKKLLMSLMWCLIINSSIAMNYGCPTGTAGNTLTTNTYELRDSTAGKFLYLPEEVPPAAGIAQEELAAVRRPELIDLTEEDVAGPSGVRVGPEHAPMAAAGSSKKWRPFPRENLEKLVEIWNAEFAEYERLKIGLHFDANTHTPLSHSHL